MYYINHFFPGGLQCFIVKPNIFQDAAHIVYIVGFKLSMYILLGLVVIFLSLAYGKMHPFEVNNSIIYKFEVHVVM